MAKLSPAVNNRTAINRNELVVLVALAGVSVALPFVAKPILDSFGNTVFSDLFSAVNSTLIFVLLALGLNIVVGYAGLLDLGYAAFFAIGGYTMAFLTSPQSPFAPGFQLSFWVALPISFLMAALFGVLLGAPTLGLRGDYLAIVTLGFGEIVPITFTNLSVTGGVSGLAGLTQPTIPFVNFQFSASTISAWYLVTLVVVFFSIFMIRRLVDSRIGRAWMAMREDEIAAASMGIDLVRTKLLAFGLGAAFAGFAGAIYANSLSSANPSQFKFDVSVLVLSMIILGGLGNIWGVIFGAVVLAMSDRYIIPFFTGQFTKIADGIQLESKLVDGIRIVEPNILKDILTNVGTNSRLLVFGVILVLMMRLRPEGIFPNSRRKMELHAADSDQIQPQATDSDNSLDDAERRHNINYNPSVEERSDSDKK